MDLELKTERLVIQPFRDSFLAEYYREFTDDITKYQYPDVFPNMETAKGLVSEFVSEMEQGNMLELVILTRSGEFIGCMEAFGIREKTPEVGLWLKSSAQGKGYGYEALKGLLTYLSAHGAYQHYLYEVDVRNLPSVSFQKDREMVTGGDLFMKKGGKIRKTP